MVIWGKTWNHLGQIEIESRISARPTLQLFNDSLISIPAAFQLPPWSGASLKFSGDDLLPIRIKAAEKTAEIALSGLLVQRAIRSDRPETALLVIRDDSTNAGLAALKARTLVRLARLTDAVRFLEQAVLLFPDRPDLWSIYSTLLAVAGDMSGAAEMARKAVSIDGRFVYAHIQLAHLEHINSNHSSATAHLERAYDVADSSMKQSVAKALARRFAALGDYRKAELLIDEMITTDDSLLEWQNSLADLYLLEESYLQRTREVASVDQSGYSDEIVRFLLGERNEEALLNPPFKSEADSLLMTASGLAILGMAYLFNFGRSLEHPAPDVDLAREYLNRSLRYGKHPNATRGLVLAELAGLARMR